MRALSTAQDAALAAKDRSAHVRVEIDTSGLGTWIDLTTYEGRNWLGAVSYDEALDNAIRTATVEVRREEFLMSLSPLMEMAKANQRPWGTYLPFLTVGRAVRIFVAVVALDATPVASDWVNVFEGAIDDLDLGSTEAVMKFSCRDKAGALQDAFVESQSVYGSGGGTLVETVMQQILTAWAPSPAPTLYVPVSPGFAILPYIQQKEPVLEALRKLAQQFGWDVRYKWDGGTSAWRLTLYNPGRGSTTSLRTFGPSDYASLRSPKLSRQGVRNYIRVVWTDAATKTRQATVVQDVNSVLKYGRRFMELVEASSSQIDSSAEALALANAALNDLSEPGMEKGVEMPLFWAAELGDLYTFQANGTHYDTDQLQAVVGVQTRIESGSATTIMGLCGKIRGLFARWLQQEARPGVGSGADFQAPGTPGSTLQEPSIGTVVITYDDPQTLSPPVTDWANSECHVDGPYDTAPGGDFTPTASTLKQIARSTRFEIAGLVPGKWYRIKIVVVDVKGNRATATSVQQQATERVGPYHANPDSEFGTINPNGDFGIMTKGSAVPPDAWRIRYTTWLPGAVGTFYFVTTASQQGDKALIHRRYTTPPGGSANIEHLFYTEPFPVAPGQLYRLDWTWKWVNGSVGVNGTGFWLKLELFDAARVSLGLVNVNLGWYEIYHGAYSIGGGGTFRSLIGENVWASDRTWYQLPVGSSARFASIVGIVNNDQSIPGVSVYSDLYFDRLRIAKSLPVLEHKGQGTTRSCATNVWTKPWFTPALVNPSFGIDTAFGFTRGVVATATEHRYTIMQTGIYTIFGRTAWSSVADAKSMNARLLLNGAVLLTGPTVHKSGMTQAAADVIWGPGPLNAGDYIELEGLHNDTTARSFDMSANQTALFIRQVSAAEGR